jgi:hypothetical protein
LIRNSRAFVSWKDRKPIMRRSLAPMLFDEPDPAAREAQRTSPVAKTEPSPAAHRKAVPQTHRPGPACPRENAGEPLPVHSFHTLLGDLATLTRDVVRLGRDRLTAILATPTQHRPRSARPHADRVDGPTPPTANWINGLHSKEGKVQPKEPDVTKSEEAAPWGGLQYYSSKDQRP